MSFLLNPGNAGFNSGLIYRPAPRHGHGVPSAGQPTVLIRAFLDFQTGLGNTGGIGEAQCLTPVDPDPGTDLNFPFPLMVEL